MLVTLALLTLLPTNNKSDRACDMTFFLLRKWFCFYFLNFFCFYHIYVFGTSLKHFKKWENPSIVKSYQK